MNKTINIVFIICIVVFTTSLLVFTVQILGKDSDNLATIISGLLSFFGGSTGAFGAYLVARFQMNKEKENNKINQLANELPVYAALVFEFEKVVEFLEGESSKVSHVLLSEQYPTKRMKFYQVSMDIWDKKWQISDSILLRDIILFQNKLKQMRKSYEINIDSLEKKRSDSYGKDYYWDIKKKEESIKLERQEIWKRIPGDYEKSKEILSSLKQQRSIIQKVINKEISPFDDKVYLKDI
ncbi:hypothetical protein P4562_17415 [Lysinibacillus xylanilyticus]|uniref:hypothetical protein n=1 Tax=Lysinibacillus xylanilyticus TaxID=582475 RepID=UPI002E1A07E8|nr:hypothetical protein [Lysinibacillus xylanilyticus]